MIAACPELPEESDLVPGVYEGGLKVWEASLDLVEHLVYLKGSSSRDAAGSGLFAQDEATAVTGRRRSVLEVSYVHRGRPVFSEEAVWATRLRCSTIVSVSACAVDGERVCDVLVLRGGKRAGKCKGEGIVLSCVRCRRLGAVLTSEAVVTGREMKHEQCAALVGLVALNQLRCDRHDCVRAQESE